jgi:two-component system sensor kinase FixL
MPKGGRLTIAGREEAAAGGGGLVEVAFSDTGEGIAPERLGKIMEPLHSTKARGLGLGLAIARSILEKNNGSLRVSSEPGKGSTFTVTLRSEWIPSEG